MDLIKLVASGEKSRGSFGGYRRSFNLVGSDGMSNEGGASSSGV